MQELKSEYGASSKLYFIIGSDCLYEIEQWHQWEHIWDLAKVIVFKRLDFPIKDIGKSIEISSGPIIDISSSAIRDRVNKDKSITYLVPESVHRYIHDNRLYTN